MSAKDPPHQERSFGLSVGGVCSAIAVWFAWRGRVGRAEIFGVVGMVLMTAGAAAPALLRIPSALWWRGARALGWFNTRVLLGLAFALVLTPLGLWWRLIGFDPLTRRRDRRSGWSVYPARYRDKKHYQRMY